MQYFRKTIKAICMLHLFLAGIAAHTQEFKDKQLHTLSSLGLAHENFDMTEEKINADFHKILKLDKIRRGRSIAGKILLPVGAIVAGIGAKMITDGNKSYQWAENQAEGPNRGQEARQNFNGIAGGGLIIVGASKIILSTSMLVSAKRRKKERDRLLDQYEMTNKSK